MFCLNSLIILCVLEKIKNNNNNIYIYIYIYIIIIYLFIFLRNSLAEST